MNNYDILQALNNIDDEYLVQARAKRKTNKKLWVAFGSMAAALALIAAIPVTLNALRIGGGASSGSNIVGGDKLLAIGTPVTTDRGTLTLVEHNEVHRTLRFTFDKVNDLGYGFGLYGYDSENDRYYDAYSPYNETPSARPNAIIRYDLFSYAVNGQSVESVPFESGYYEIVLDYSELSVLCDDIENEVFVVGFGVFTF